MAKPQQVVDPNVNPSPTEQELLEYRVKMDRLVSAFREEVQVRGVNAYTKLIHESKITVSKFNADLVEADQQTVLKSIKRHDGQHFKQGFVVKVKATASREHHPDFSAAQYDIEVHSAICKLHLDTADVSRKMADIHYNLALIKTKVSPSDFIKISTSIPLPLTTVEIVDPAKPSAVDIDRYPQEKPTGTTRQMGKRKNLMDKGPTGLVSGTVHQCKFCEKMCTSESGLTNHINNVHQERQNIFRCCKCGHKFNVFNMYIDHLGTHPKNEYKCLATNRPSSWQP